MLAEDPPAFWGIHPLKYSQNFNYFIWSYILILSKVIGLAIGITINDTVWSRYLFSLCRLKVCLRTLRLTDTPNLWIKYVYSHNFICYDIKPENC
jgi:hypothetical protein